MGIQIISSPTRSHLRSLNTRCPCTTNIHRFRGVFVLCRLNISEKHCSCLMVFIFKQYIPLPWTSADTHMPIEAPFVSLPKCCGFPLTMPAPAQIDNNNGAFSLHVVTIPNLLHIPYTPPSHQKWKVVEEWKTNGKLEMVTLRITTLTMFAWSAMFAVVVVRWFGQDKNSRFLLIKNAPAKSATFVFTEQ